MGGGEVKNHGTGYSPHVKAVPIRPPEGRLLGLAGKYFHKYSPEQEDYNRHPEDH